MQSRRDCLKAMGLAVTAAVGLGSIKAAASEVPGSISQAPASNRVTENLLGVRASDRFAGCSVMAVGTLELGAIPVYLAGTGGEVFRIDVLRHDERTPGVARGGSLGVYMSNNGDGSLATREEHGLAAMAFAGHLGRREASGARVSSLLTLAERAKRRQRDQLGN